jgi:hypothetical protein
MWFVLGVGVVMEVAADMAFLMVFVDTEMPNGHSCVKMEAMG